MSPRAVAIVLFSLPFACGFDDPSGADRSDALKRHGLDPAKSLESRVRETPESVLAMFKDDAAPAPKEHLLTGPETLELQAAFAGLPPLHRRILRERLRSVSFLDGMPNTALTSPVNPTEPYKLFHITIRAGILNETVSQWLTWKERSCFDATGSDLSVSVQAGDRDALLYVLIHEATHIVDACLTLTPALSADGKPAGAPPERGFTAGVWTDRTTPAPRYREKALEHTRFRAGGKVLPIVEAQEVYQALGRTPFVSLYGASNWFDDLAEFVAISHFTEKLGTPIRVVISKSGKEVFASEPMQNETARQRIGAMKPFYE